MSSSDARPDSAASDRDDAAIAIPGVIAVLVLVGVLTTLLG